MQSNRLVDILLVEDSPTDVMMTREALAQHKVLNPLHVAEDGQRALDYLRSDEQHPGLIILDLNLPKMDGLELLNIIKTDKELRSIPVIILTTSKSEEDIARSYDQHANCFISKPLDFAEPVDAFQVINEFWFKVVSLPKDQHSD